VTKGASNLKAHLLTGAGLALAVLLSLQIPDATPGLAIPALPIGLFGFGIMALVARRHARSTSDALNPFTLITAYSALAYPIGGVVFSVLATQGGKLERLTLHSLLLGQLLGLLGWSAFSIGYLQRRMIIPPFLRVWPVAGGPSKARLAIVYMIGTLARLLVVAQGRYFHIASSAGDLQATKSSFLVTTVAGLPALVVILALVKRRPDRRYPILVIGVLFELVYRIPTGARADLLAFVGSLLAVRYYRAGRLPWLVIAPALVVTVFVVFPLVLAFRGNDASYSKQLGGSSQRAVAETFAGGTTGLLSNGSLAFLTRFSDVTSGAAVLQADSRQVVGFPDHYPETALLTVLIPRSVRPNKADPGTYGNAFGRTFGFTYQLDLITSINVPHATEFYLGYGWLGVVLFMPLVGMGYRWINDSLPRNRTASCALYCLLVLVIPQTTENIVALGFFSLLKILMVYTVVIRFTWDRNLLNKASASIITQAIADPRARDMMRRS